MLKKYFYAKFLDLYLCRRQAEKSRSECFNVADDRDLNADNLAFWDRDLAESAKVIRTVKGIAADLIGKQTALEIKAEARTDSQILTKNAVYWIPDDTEEMIEYIGRYKGNEAVTEILKKCIGGMTE